MVVYNLLPYKLSIVLYSRWMAVIMIGRNSLNSFDLFLMTVVSHFNTHDSIIIKTYRIIQNELQNSLWIWIIWIYDCYHPTTKMINNKKAFTEAFVNNICETSYGKFYYTLIMFCAIKNYLYFHKISINIKFV